MYDDADSVTTLVGLARIDIHDGTGVLSVRDNECGLDFANAIFGHFLVRPSPVAMPVGFYVGPALLLLLALTGLVMMRRRGFTCWQ